VLFCTVLVSLSEPADPGVAPPIATPYPVLVATPVLKLQFLTVLFVVPKLVPKLAKATTVGAVVLLLVIVKLLSVPPLLLPSMVTYLAPLSLINAPDATEPVMVAVVFGFILKYKYQNWHLN